MTHTSTEPRSPQPGGRRRRVPLRRTSAAAAGLVLAFVLGGCGSDGASGDGASGAGATTDAESGTGSGSVDVRVADSDLGRILVDGDGNTLYAFTPDSATASTCDDGCASTWPPLIVDGSPEADGVEGALGTVDREDGSTQLSVDGHPLYTYAADAEPGDTTGQGVGGAWYVVDAEGHLVGGSASGTDTSGGDGGY